MTESRSNIASSPHTPLSEPACQEWERTYSLFTHLTLLTVHLLIPVIPALVMWLIKRDQSTFVDDHGKEAVNFQLSLLLYTAATFLVGFLTCGVGWVLWPLIYILGIVGMILAAVAASKSQYYRYPMSIRFL